MDDIIIIIESIGKTGILINSKTLNKKSHTCEEGGAHLKNLCLTFIDEIEKQLFIKKTVEVGQ